ncbi:MAG: SUMF1/EgtB/PvdO family nonheme iron enzyme [Magnetococcales bacterium]|nr:SUMF1/EgtB/PvdO family nonheme iron enzyme [Magnetococcales bacterium]
MNLFLQRLSFLALLWSLALPSCREAEGSMIIEWERLVPPTADRRGDEEPVPGKNWTDSVTGIGFVWVPGGCFQMGSPPWKEGREHDEGPLHSACVADFWLGKTEVTQGQWQAIMRVNPSLFQKGDDHPLEQVSWIDAEVISESLNERFKGKARFRLPTEAEWEFACRERGDDIVYAGRADPGQIAWSAEKGSHATHPVARLRANRLGLRDMNGNVWEWTLDTYRPDAYANHDEHNPAITGEGPFRVIRGGGWKDGTQALRCANRGFERHTAKRPDIGFRLAAVVDMEADEKRPPLFEIPF